MNRGYLLGYVVNEVKYDFILNGKNDAIAIFSIRLSNNSVIYVISYNKNADFCYRRLKVGDKIFVVGSFNSKFQIISDCVYVV